jgi:hypothetical protein
MVKKLKRVEIDDASKTAQWLAVTGTAEAYTTPGVIIGLWGADGDKLIVSRAEDLCLAKTSCICKMSDLAQS